jgi:hypothetical protein
MNRIPKQSHNGEKRGAIRPRADFVSRFGECRQRSGNCVDLRPPSLIVPTGASWISLQLKNYVSNPRRSIEGTH